MKLLINLLLIVMPFFMLSCKENKEDKKWLEERLIKRSKEYANSFIELDVKNMWNLSSAEFKKGQGNDKRKYIKTVEKELKIILEEYSSFEDLIEEVEIRDDKAILKMKRITQTKKDSKKSEGFVFYFWIFENNDWYMNFPDQKSPICVGWWGKLKKVDEKDFTDREKLLKNRVMEFHNSLMNRDYGEVWEMLDEELKTEWSSNKEKYVELRIKARNRSNLDNIDFSFEEIKVFENIAVVKNKYLYKRKHDSYLYEESIRDTWVYENNNWFLHYTGTNI